MSNALRLGSFMVAARVERGEPEQVYVLASDYDALAARLADEQARSGDRLVELTQAQARLAEAMHDIDAYRGALGYAVPASHDGRLSDGTTPICGLCDARHRATDSAALESRVAKLERLLREASGALTEEVAAAGDDSHPVIRRHKKLSQRIDRVLTETVTAAQEAK